MRIPALAAILILLSGLALAACGAAPAGSGSTYSKITPARLAEMLKSKDFLFVNVHIPYEGEIEQTDAFIPYEERGPQRVGDYPADKNARIVLYCRSGRMSSVVAQELVKAGYTDVSHLEGGMADWKAAGYPLVEK